MSDGRPEGGVLKGGRLCYRVEGHPLADKQGYVGAARFVLFEHFERLGIEPVCWRCGKRVVFRRGGPGRTMKRAQRMSPLLVEYLDGDDWNLSLANLKPVCSSCLHAHVKAPPARDERGFFAARA